MPNAECGMSRGVSCGRTTYPCNSAFPVPHSALGGGAHVSELPYRVEKPWGHELIWARTDRYVGKILHIEPGHVLSLQYHNKKRSEERRVGKECRSRWSPYH